MTESRLVGRAKELLEFGSRVDSLDARGGRLFMVSGEPGIGKTRLAEEAGRLAQARGFGVHWGRCWEVGGAPSFWPWLQIFRSLSRDARTKSVIDAYVDVLARILPELRPEGARLEPPPVAESLPAEERFRMFEDLLALLRAAAEQTPQLLILDDLHAADPSSVVLLRLVSRELHTSRLLIIATCRDRETKPEPSVNDAIHAVAREATTLALARLDVDEVAKLLSLSGEWEVSRAVAERVQASTDGNPLFVEQVSRLLATRNAFSSSLDEVPIPARIRDMVRDRLAAADPSTRRCLNVAAVLGRAFDLPLLAAALRASETEVATWVARTIDAGLVREIDVGQYEICHALFRETIYRSLPSEERARLHERAAEVLEQTRRPERAAGELARHLLLAAPRVGPARARQGCAAAAERAMGALAFEDAASILSMVVAELGASLDNRERAEILVLLGEAHARAGAPALAAKACESAAAIARASTDAELLSRAALALGAELMPGQISAPLVALLQEAHAALPVAVSSLRAKVIARLAAALQPAIDPSVPISLAREAVAMARQLGDVSTLRVVLYQAGSALVDFGAPLERIGWDDELLLLSETAGDVLGVLRAHVRLFFDYVELGQARAADRQLEAHAQVADRLGMPEHQWRTLAMRTLRALWDGRFDDADTHRAAARRIAARTRIPEAPLGEVFLDQGAAAARGEEIPRVDESIALTRRFPAAVEMESCVRALVAAQRGDIAGARAAAAEIPPDSIFFSGTHPGTRLLVDVAAITEDAELAQRLYVLLLPLAPRLFSWGRIAMFTEGPVTWLLGSLATTVGRFDDAERHFEEALAHCVRAGMRPYEAIACLEYARLLALRGAAGETKLAEVAERGRRIAESIGAGAVARRFSAFWLAQSIPSASHAPSTRPPDGPLPIELTKDGDIWTVRWRGRELHAKDSRGIRWLSELVGNPGREFHVLSLAAADGADLGDAGEVLDGTTRDAYRERVEDLRGQLREAEAFGDPTRSLAYREELDRVTEELARAVGLGGRGRRVGAAAERARVNVQKRIRDAIRRLAAQDPILGRTLERCVRTGTFCAYEPE